MKNNIKTGIWYIVDDVDRSISKIDILHVDSKTITEYCGSELIDALYGMILKLKEEGVI